MPKPPPDVPPKLPPAVSQHEQPDHTLELMLLVVLLLTAAIVALANQHARLEPTPLQGQPHGQEEKGRQGL